MPQLPHNAGNFPAALGAELVGSHRLTFSWSELVWAAITVGRAELLHVLRHGPFSTFEIVYRAAILYANLRETASTDLTRSDAYNGLDPSEKGAISYFMGLTVAKLFAHGLLDVPWLMHLDVYREELRPVFNGNSRLDLVGQDSFQQWVAIESKGRTNGYDGEALARAKAQVESLTSIQGQQLTLRIAMLTHFGSGILQCEADDPKKRKGDPRTIDLPLSREKLFEGYYRPFREWLRESPTRVERVRNQSFVVADVRDVDLTVGLRQDMTVGVPIVAPLPQRRNEQTQYIGADGVMVRTGPLWSDDNMRRQPQERRRE